MLFNVCITLVLILTSYLINESSADSDIIVAAAASGIRDNIVPLTDDTVSTCVSCQKSRLSTEEMYAKKIEQEKQKILAKLRLNDPPNVTLDQRDIPSVLRQRVTDDFSKTNAFDPETEDETEDKDMLGKTKVIYIFGEYPKRGGTKNLQCFSKEGKLAACIDLKLSHEISTKQILNATLWFYKAVTPEDDPSRNHVIRIAELKRHHNKLIPDEEVVAEIETTIDDGWLEVDVTALVKSWHHRLFSSKRHNTLQITCVTCPASVTPPVSADERPFLEIKSGTTSNSRRKRSNVCSPELYSNCCLKPFYVNFTEIGWNTWIIQPPGYYANYCTGSCRMTSTTVYHKVLSTVGLTKEVRGETYDRELIPCCSPTKMSPLSLLYAFNVGEIRKKVLDNMIVKSCGC